jgi:hypothetical protein
VVVGCDDFKSKQDSAAGDSTLLAENLGCIQGTVIDGLTREGVDLEAVESDNGSGIRAMVGGTAVTATPAAEFLGASARTAGEYSICNIPLDETYNLIIDLPGFQRVEGLFLIESTLPNRGLKPNELELTKRVPTQIVNIVTYPIGVRTGDLTVSVTHEGHAVEGARVQLLHTGQNKLDASHNNELVYTNVKALPVALDTDAKGVALFKADTLVLGATYQYRVFPPVGSSDRGFAEGFFTLGLVGNDSRGLPYRVQVELNEITPALRVVSTNASLSALGTADLELVFNRPVELLFDTVDEVKATLANQKKAELTADVAGNGKAEQVSVTVDGERVRLSPKFDVKPDRMIEPELEVLFSGLRVKAVDDAGSLSTWTMPATMSVKVFGGVNQMQVPTSIATAPSASGDAQTGPAAMELPQPLAVVVLDQYGTPVKAGTQVTFTAQAGQGTLRQGTLTGALEVTAPTDTLGVARAYWTLPNLSGSYAVVASIGDLDPVTFKATATDWVKQILVSTVPQTAPAATELPAFTAQLYDQSGKQWLKATPITITAGSGSGTVREVTQDPASAAATLTTTTSADGRATLVWMLGETAGNQQLVVSAPGTVATLQLTVAATNRFDSLVAKTAPTAAVVGTDAIFAVEIRDQNGLPIDLSNSSIKVRFVLEVGAGRLRGINDTAGTGTNTLDVLPLASGLAELKFTPTDVLDGKFRIVATYTASGRTGTVTLAGTVTGS